MNANRRSFLSAAALTPVSAMASKIDASKLGVQSEFFDAQHYANHNADLLVYGLLTYSQLRSHWLSNGISEGRIAHPEFHAASYRDRYADLRAAFGSNLALYYQHYVTNGQYEGRNAKQANALIARLDDVSIGASPRCAGAVDSLFFHDKESVNSFDHGRQLQTACYDTRYEGCYNPTQAGGMTDGMGYPSSSRLIYGAVLDNGKTLHTRTQCAYWTRPGEKITAQGIYNCTAVNKTVTSDFIADTKYTLARRNGVTAIQYDLIWNIGAEIPAGHFMSELTTGYHTADFSVGYEIVSENGYAARLRHMGDHLGQAGQERPYPAILTTPDGARAIGVYAEPVQGASTRYATWLWRFGQNQQTNDCSKWSVVRRYSNGVSNGDQVSARCHIVIGQVTDVHLELARLMRG